ncbi:MAG TPA: SpoIIE family protein phosphatase [Thermoanaerobaculia bacterium]|nr:SpoIIE family protein phosphatase [Thermoanaerobaculia bacterium]
MSAPLFRLHVVPAEGAPFDYLLRRDSLVVGRALDVDLTISDPFLSRRHSRFFLAGDDLFVEDLGSRNGTEVNGRTIQGPERLAPGDVIKVSNSVVTVFEDRPTLSGRSVREEDPLEDGTILRSASELLGRQSAPTAAGEAGLRRYADRLRLLNQIHQALGRPLAMEELVELILDRVFDHLKPDRGVILLRDGDEYRVAASRGGAEGPAFSRSLIREVEKGMAAVVFDVHADERFSAAQSMLISGVRSLIAAPLLDLEEVLGLIVLESRSGARQFSEEDLELLVSLASVAALHLRNLALANEAAERRRLEEELALARRIQMALLPNRLPDVPGWELYGGNIPSRGVSGDYYEVLERDGGRECVLMVADVAGKGMAASLLTVSLQALSTGPIMDGLPPDEICANLSRLLYLRTPPEKYATAFLGVLEPATGRLRYTNAGHNPPLLVRGDGAVEELGSTGVPLGLLPQARYQAALAELGPGDLLVLYTDGLVEACGSDGEEYGLARLREACRRHRGERDLMAIADALESDLEELMQRAPFADDRTIVLARRSIQ